MGNNAAMVLADLVRAIRHMERAENRAPTSGDTLVKRRKLERRIRKITETIERVYADLNDRNATGHC